MNGSQFVFIFTSSAIKAMTEPHTQTHTFTETKNKGQNRVAFTISIIRKTKLIVCCCCSCLCLMHTWKSCLIFASTNWTKPNNNRINETQRTKKKHKNTYAHTNLTTEQSIIQKWASIRSALHPQRIFVPVPRTEIIKKEETTTTTYRMRAYIYILLLNSSIHMCIYEWLRIKIRLDVSCRLVMHFIMHSVSHLLAAAVSSWIFTLSHTYRLHPIERLLMP